MKKLLWILLGCVSAVASHAAITIVPTTTGDGFHHDELGSSYDYFSPDATENEVHYQFYGTSDTMIRRISYMQFSLASVPQDAVIQQATLNIYLTGIHYGDESPSGGFLKHRSNASAATGLASQRLGGDQTLVELKDQPMGWLSVDVTSYVQNDLNNGYSYSVFSGDPNTSGYFRNAGFSFYSADAASNQPYLAITIPEPRWTALAMALGALILVRVYRRRS